MLRTLLMPMILCAASSPALAEGPHIWVENPAGKRPINCTYSRDTGYGMEPVSIRDRTLSGMNSVSLEVDPQTGLLFKSELDCSVRSPAPSPTPCDFDLVRAAISREGRALAKITVPLNDEVAFRLEALDGKAAILCRSVSHHLK